jgi:hypothetical protein
VKQMFNTKINIPIARIRNHYVQQISETPHCKVTIFSTKGFRDLLSPLLLFELNAVLLHKEGFFSTKILPLF